MTDEDILKLRETLRRVASWVDEREVETRIGNVELVLAARSADESEKENHLSAAENAFENAIAYSPMDPFSWVRLCQIRLKTNGQQDGTAAQALSMSLMTGPYERALAIQQIGFAAILWDQLSEDDQRTVAEKVRWIETLERRDLAALAKRDPRAATLVIRSLAGGDMHRFTRFVAFLNKK
ncbi:hypothetical protein [Thalassospira mesophila]|nr:hypothetical protein [Thalassospira mesophila]